MVYGNLSDSDVACGGECGGEFNQDGAMGGGVGSVTCAERPVESVVDAPYWVRSQRGPCQYCWLKCRRRCCAGRAQCTHGEALQGVVHGCAERGQRSR